MRRFRKFVTFAAVALVLGVAGGALARSDVITQRKAILKSFGEATPGAMLQGKQPFDVARAQVALRTYQRGAAKLPRLFPVGSETGGSTEALPAIWQNRRDFEGRFAKLAADARTAASAIRDEGSFRAEFPKVLANCKGCHDQYRVKK